MEQKQPPKQATAYDSLLSKQSLKAISRGIGTIHYAPKQATALLSQGLQLNKGGYFCSIFSVRQHTTFNDIAQAMGSDTFPMCVAHNIPSIHNTRKYIMNNETDSNMNVAILSQVERTALKAALLLDSVMDDPSMAIDKKARLARDMLETYTKLYRVATIHEQQPEEAVTAPAVEDEAPQVIFNIDGMSHTGNVLKLVAH